MTVNDAFVAEAAEQASSFANLMLDLENGSGRAGEGHEARDAVVRELFRFAHNLKGMSAMEGVTELNRLAHASEDLLDRYRTGGHDPTTTEVDTLLAAADAMSAVVDELASGTVVSTHAALVAHLVDLAGVSPGAGRPTEPATGVDLGDPDDPLPPGLPDAALVLHIVLAPEAVLPGARATVLLRQIEATVPVAFTAPDRATIAAGAARSFLIGIDAPPRDPAGSEAAPGTWPDALVDRLRAAPDVARVIERGRPSPSASTSESPRSTDSVPAADAPTATSGSVGPSTVRVELGRLDTLAEITGELVIEQNRLDALIGVDADADLKRALADLRRTVGDLKRLVQRVRMVPIAPVFTRLQRLVRETARELGTPVVLDLEGETTEVDRSVADEITQPLVHLIRNAIDHGIEPAAVRLERGKPEPGAILVRAQQHGDHVVFEVGDDGGGLDEERIAAKALRTGLLDRRQAETLDRASILDLIFAAGFSTNEDVSLVSGRGVGLDVVRAAVNRFGGGIEVDSEPGVGTTFRIRLPLSLVVIDALIVRVATELWALPLHRLVETIAIRDGAIRSAPGPTGSAVAHRTGLLPVIDGGTTLAHGAAIASPRLGVVIETVGRPYAVTVDELVGHAEMVVRPVPVATGIDHLAGVASLADGRLALVLDVAAFVDGVIGRRTGELAPAARSDGSAVGDAAMAEPIRSDWVDGVEVDLDDDPGFDVELPTGAEVQRCTERELFDSGLRRTQPVLDRYIRAISTVSETESRDPREVAAAVVAHPEVVPVAFTLGRDLHAVLVFAIVAETRLLAAMGAGPPQQDAAIDELGNMLGSQFVAALADDHGLSVTLSTPLRPQCTVDDIVYLLRGAAPRGQAPPVWHASLLGGPEPIQVLLAIDDVSNADAEPGR